MMLKRILLVVGSLVALALVAVLASTLFFVSRFTMPPNISNETILTQLAAQGVADPEALLATGSDFTITSPFDYPIEATLLPAENKNSRNYVILNHDFGRNQLASLAYYQLFHDFDFNVIVYSSRAHGESGSSTMTYGVKEKYDLQAIVNKVLGENPEAVIGLHGVGLGAATVLEYAEIATLEIDFYIAQGSFQDFNSLLNYELAQQYPQLNWLPLTNIVKWWVHFTDTFASEAASPLNAIAEIPRPVLLIYGSEDPYRQFGDVLAKATSNPFVETYIVEGANATTVFQTNPEQYTEVVHKFIRSTFE